MPACRDSQGCLSFEANIPDKTLRDAMRHQDQTGGHRQGVRRSEPPPQSGRASEILRQIRIAHDKRGDRSDGRGRLEELESLSEGQSSFEKKSETCRYFELGAWKVQT